MTDSTTSGPTDAKVLVDIRGAGGYITFNRPRVLNAIDGEMKTLLVEAVERLEGDDAVRAIVLTGSDCGAFSTGSDLKAIAANFDGGVDISGMQARSADYFGAVTAADKPVIAAIDGYAVGGGFELALACDIRLATVRSSLGLPEPRVGMMGEYGLDHLCRLIPLGEALHLQLSGNRIDATRAHSVGLLQQLASDRHDLFARVEQLVGDIGLCSPVAVRTIKRVVREGRNLPADYAAEFSQPFRDAVHNSPAAAEGARAFAEKRRPSWVEPA
jgi:enoyl-CoA hydratase/carnithine racemase